MTAVDDIPDEIWLHIALFAELKSLFALRLVRPFRGTIITH